MNGMTITSLLALFPAMVGPLPIEEGSRALVLALCGGGNIEIALESDDGTLPAPATTPCCAKGCHTGERKRLVDRGQ